MALKKKQKNKGIVIYQAKSGAIELRGDFTRETIWATQAQIAEVFNIDRTVVTKHIGNILKIKEVSEKSNVQKMHIANSDKPTAFHLFGFYEKRGLSRLEILTRAPLLRLPF